MPNCDFYACGDDHRKILEFVLDQGDCDIYELYSNYDSPLRQFKSIGDFEEHFGFSDWNDPNRTSNILLHLYPHESGGAVHIRRISLKPSSCNGSTFRYTSEGWGMVQLYLESPRKGRLTNSNTNHISQVRAKTWRDTISDMGEPDDWDWKKVASFSGRLNHAIRKLAVDKKHSRVILSRAAALSELAVHLQ